MSYSHVLDCIRAVQSDDTDVNDCATSLASVLPQRAETMSEGSTNLTYLFADKEKTDNLYKQKSIQQLFTAGAEP